MILLIWHSTFTIKWYISYWISYGTSVVIIRCPLMPKIIHEWALEVFYQQFKLESRNKTFVDEMIQKNQPNKFFKSINDEIYQNCANPLIKYSNGLICRYLYQNVFSPQHKTLLSQMFNFFLRKVTNDFAHEPQGRTVTTVLSYILMVNNKLY
jgi:hypothetical protein